jgi:hypothetical protein
MSEQIRAMELFRKRLTSCRKTFSEAVKEMWSKPDKELQPIIDRVNNQLLWMRQAQSALEQNFSGRHSDTLRDDLIKAAREVETAIFNSLSSRTFPEAYEQPTKAHKFAVNIVNSMTSTLLKYKCAVAELMTTNSENDQFFTSYVMACNIKRQGETLPLYIVAVSEDVLTHDVYITHMSSISTVFDPSHLVRNETEIKMIYGKILNNHFQNRPQMSLQDAVSKIKNISLLNPKALQIELQPGLEMDKQDAISVLKNFLATECYQAFCGRVRCYPIEGAKPKFVFECLNGVGFTRVPQALATLQVEM